MEDTTEKGVPTGFAGNLHALSERMTNSAFGRYFECEQRKTNVFTELRAGTVAFLTVCYIIPVNAGILTDTGGSCDPAKECTPGGFAAAGPGCRFFDPGFAECQRDFKNNLIASTCIAAMIATFLMAVVARMPLAVASAMGVNAYFTYNVVGYLGTKRISYKEALAAAFVEGWLFLLITVSGVRGRLVELIPKNIMYATAAGIGCFLAFIGLQKSEGIALITYDAATLVTLGGCPPEYRDYMYTIGDSQLTFDNVCAKDKVTGDWSGKLALGPKSPNYACTGGQLRSATTWLGIAAGGLMVILMMKNFRGSILVGILFATFISWIPNHGATYFHERSTIPGGEERYRYFRKGATVPDTSRTAGQLSWGAFHTKELWVALITFLYLDFLDATSTMFAMARLVGDQVPGFLNAKGVWPRQMWTMIVDGFAIVVGALLGTSPLTVFAESAVGIKEGGRTGITALVIAFGFFICMFLSPIFASIPPYATGPAIILVGALMMEHSRYVQWQNLRVAAPAFLTIILMPLTYSIAYGIIGGLTFNIFLWVMGALWDATVVMSGMGGSKTMRHVHLETWAHVYVAFDKEDILVRELPGYVPIDAQDSSGHSSPTAMVAEKTVAA